MTRVVLWIIAILLFVGSAITAVNFVGFGVGFPVVFLLVAAIPIFIVAYLLWQRREKDDAAQRETADPSIPPPTDQPGWPWF